MKYTRPATPSTISPPSGKNSTFRFFVTSGIGRTGGMGIEFTDDRAAARVAQELDALGARHALVAQDDVDFAARHLLARFVGAGNFVLSTTELSVAPGTTYSSIEKYGTGTFWIKSSNSTNVTDTAGNGLVVKQGTLVIDANGTWRSKLFIENGATVTVDDSLVNFDKGRFSNYQSGISYDLTMRGGNFNLVGALSSAFPSYENFNTLVATLRERLPSVPWDERLTKTRALPADEVDLLVHLIHLEAMS